MALALAAQAGALNPPEELLVRAADGDVRLVVSAEARAARVAKGAGPARFPNGSVRL